MINLATIAGASELAGLQYIGRTTGSITISGTITGTPNTTPPSEPSILYTSFVIDTPSPDTITSMAFQAPQNGGVLPNYWYPIASGLLLHDNTNNYIIQVSTGNAPSGRTVYINLISNSTSNITISNLTFNVIAELYSYPW